MESNFWKMNFWKNWPPFVQLLWCRKWPPETLPGPMAGGGTNGQKREKNSPSWWQTGQERVLYKELPAPDSSPFSSSFSFILSIIITITRHHYHHHPHHHQPYHYHHHCRAYWTNCLLTPCCIPASCWNLWYLYENYLLSSLIEACPAHTTVKLQNPSPLHSQMLFFSSFTEA